MAKTLTQAELDALPEVHNVAVFQKDDDGSVRDVHGVDWMIGWLNGVRVKRRMFTP